MTDATKPTATEQATAYLIEKLQQMASEATSTATKQEAAAWGTRNHTRQLRYEESAEFHRALAAQINKELAHLRWASGFPGTPGSFWSDDADGGLWIHGADGRMWLLNELEEPDDPAELSSRFGPMTQVGGEV